MSPHPLKKFLVATVSVLVLAGPVWADAAKPVAALASAVTAPSCPPVGVPPAMTVVSTSAQLSAALAAATANQTIQLAPSSSFPNLTLQNLHLTNVTITSQDPAHPGVFSNLVIKTSSGLNLTHLDLLGTGGNGSNALTLVTVQNVNVQHVRVYGNTSTVQAAWATGIGINGSSNVTVSNSEIYNLYRGATAGGASDHVTFAHNALHDLRSDGLDFFAPATFITVQSNSFRDFFPIANLVNGVWVSGDHPDAIQFWTQGGSASSHDILIDGNIGIIGSGTATFQGVFITDQANLPYSNVTITNNVFAGPGPNGITLMSANGVINISNNALYPVPGTVTWFRYSSLTTSPAPIITNDVVHPAVTDGGAALWAAWQLAQNPLALTVTASPANFEVSGKSTEHQLPFVLPASAGAFTSGGGYLGFKHYSSLLLVAHPHLRGSINRPA